MLLSCCLPFALRAPVHPPDTGGITQTVSPPFSTTSASDSLSTISSSTLQALLRRTPANSSLSGWSSTSRSRREERRKGEGESGRETAWE